MFDFLICNTSDDLPFNSHLLSWKIARKESQQENVFVRIEHTYEIDEDSQLSKPFQVDFSKLFSSPFSFNSATEMSLNLNIGKIF